MLSSWARELSDQVDLEAVCEQVVARDLADSFADRSDNEHFVSSLRASVAENLGNLRALLNGSIVIDDVRLHQPLLFGALQAQLRIPQSEMQRCYRIGFYTMWEAWAEKLLTGAGEADPSEVARQVVELARLLYLYQDHVAVQVADRLSSEEQALSTSRAHVRHRLVESVLSEANPFLTPADLSTIGYEFDLHHVALLLPQMAEGAASRLAVGLSNAAGTRHSLVLPRPIDATVVWLGRLQPWTSETFAAVRDCVTSVGALATVSEAQQGLAGFREALHQAEEAERIRRAWGSGVAPRVLFRSDVALEILLLRDPELAARFVRDELNSLAEDTDENARLRETLEASYRHGSHVAAAAHLHVHEHTVRNRLRKVEELLRHPVSQRQTEIQVALRLLHIL